METHNAAIPSLLILDALISWLSNIGRMISSAAVDIDKSVALVEASRMAIPESSGFCPMIRRRKFGALAGASCYLNDRN
jgi:hypothetical protein